MAVKAIMHNREDNFKRLEPNRARPSLAKLPPGVLVVKTKTVQSSSVPTPTPVNLVSFK